MKVRIDGYATTRVMRVVDMDDDEYRELRKRLDDGDYDAPQEIMEAGLWDSTDDADFEIHGFEPAV